MKVPVGISNHHVHLTVDDYNLLFNKEFTIRNYLNQPNQFACNERVNIIGPKGRINDIIIVGPFREYTQVEVSKTDCYKLGITPPVSDSGNLINAADIVIEGPSGSILRKSCIIANRHIHVDKEIIKEKKLENIHKVSIKINGIKGGIINNVYLKSNEKAFFELHLDTDDANAFLLNNGDLVNIIIKKQKNNNKDID